MDKRLKIALPLMIHQVSEIEAFNEAKKCLIDLGEETGVPLEVGAFLVYLPGSSRTPEALARQVQNQTKNRLPIFLVETGVQQANALSYGPADPTYKSARVSDLETTLEQAARLRDLDPCPQSKLVVAPHVGILVVDSLAQGDFSLPSFYSLPDFKARRNELYERARSRAEKLGDQAEKSGLLLAIENTFSAVVENAGFWEKRPRDPELNFGINYQAFQDITSLLEISRGELVLDVNHLTAMQAIPDRFRRNEDTASDTLFAVLGINSWGEFKSQAGTLQDYLPYTRAFHLSPVDGLGIRVPRNTEIGKRWGDGTGPDLIDKKTYNHCLTQAIKEGLPVAIEVDYSFNPLTFKEAVQFLEPILRDYRAQ